MVNRITHFVETTTRNSAAMGGEVVQQEKQDGHRWLEFLESHVRQRPRLFLGAAFTLGVGLAWLIKRK